MKTFRNIKENPILKGFYVDNYQNRKLGRVGQEYDKEAPKRDIAEEENLSLEQVSDENKREFIKNLTDNKHIQNVLIRNEKSIWVDKDKKAHCINPFFLTKEDSSDFHVKDWSSNPTESEKINNILDSFLSKEKTDGTLNFIFKRIDETFNSKYSNADWYIESEKKYWGKRAYEILKNTNIKSKEDLHNFICNSRRTDFYNLIKAISKSRDYQAEQMITYRFAVKYKKYLFGEGWHFSLKEEKYSENKNNTINLLSQIEFAVEDCLGDLKDKLFINNPNLRQISYEDDNWDSCYYNSGTKSILIKKGYVDVAQTMAKLDNYSVNSKEKFFVQTFLHELGHSIEIRIQKEKENRKRFEDFAETLGWGKENAHISILGEVAKDINISNQLDNLSYWSRIKRDKLEELKGNFDKNIQSYYGNFRDDGVENFTVSLYSNKSASEAFAEYFGYYVAGKNKIDAALKKWKENPQKFMDETDFKDLFPYNRPNKLFQRQDLISEDKNALKYLSDADVREDKDRYNEIYNFNMKIFEKVKQMVEAI